MVIKYIALGAAAVFAASAPLLFNGSHKDNHANQSSDSSLIPWPSEYQGKPLNELPLTDKEQLFIAGFPGQIKRFSDGHREFIVRKVNQPTRMLHPAIDCFKGIGYRITPLPIESNHLGIKMGCFNAQKNTQNLKVCEYIQGSNGQSWSDVSSWYWQAFFNDGQSNKQGWLSVVIAESI